MTRTIHQNTAHFLTCPHPASRVRKHAGDRICGDQSPPRPVPLATCLSCPLHGSTAPPPPRSPKVGDVLAELLAKEWGATVTAQCNCADRIRQMNEWGPDGCDREIETILGWIIDSASSVAGLHNLPPEWAKRTALRPLVQEAIRTVREWTPPQDAAADLAAA